VRFPVGGARPIRPGAAVTAAPPVLSDLAAEDRESVLPILKESFVGIYRWHAKRTLRSVSRVRVARRGEEIVGAAMLETLAPEVGYVYYIFVAAAHRREGIAGLLLDDALAAFGREGRRVVYAAAEEDNAPSIALFRSRGFREVERKELGYQDGGLGAWGLRSRMMLVGGEVLLGKRIAPGPAAEPQPNRPLT
jgi:ribosomal protein S18 acetylase RimI-like enzyme